MAALNPYWQARVVVGETHVVRTVPARELLCYARFDVAAKALWARDQVLGRRSQWATELYREHLAVWSNGKFVESDGQGKQSFDD